MCACMDGWRQGVMDDGLIIGGMVGVWMDVSLFTEAFAALATVVLHTEEPHVPEMILSG